MGLQNGKTEFQAIWREEQKSEYDLKNPVEKCEDLECRDHAVIRVSQIKEQLEAVKEKRKKWRMQKWWWPPWMASQDRGVHSCEECVLEGSDYFQ